MALVDEIKAYLRGLMGSYDSSSVDISAQVSRMFVHSFDFEKAQDTNAASTTATTYFWYADNDVKIKEVKYVPRGSATLHADNYATIKLQVGDGAGGAVANVASVTTQSTNMAAGVPYAIALTAGSEDVDEGEVVAFQITKTGSGVQLPAGKLVVHVEER